MKFEEFLAWKTISLWRNLSVYIFKIISSILKFPHRSHSCNFMRILAKKKSASNPLKYIHLNQQTRNINTDRLIKNHKVVSKRCIFNQPKIKILNESKSRRSKEIHLNKLQFWSWLMLPSSFGFLLKTTFFNCFFNCWI